MVGRGVKAMAVPTPIKAIILSIAFSSKASSFDPSSSPDTLDTLNLKKQAELENPSPFMTGLSKILPSTIEGNPDAPLIVERVYYTRDEEKA
jgi:hypothetical protein